MNNDVSLIELKTFGLSSSNMNGFHHRILLVDGDRRQCALHAAALALAGFATCRVSNGKEALEALDVVRFDVVLAEAVTPGLGGRGLVHAMRTIGDMTAVVIISGGKADKFIHDIPQDEVVEEVPRTASSRDLISAIYRSLQADSSWVGVAGSEEEYSTHSLS